jgi:hypothetical protein
MALRLAAFFVAFVFCAGSSPAQSAQSASAQPQAAAVVFWEDGFPAADTAPPRREALASLLPDAAWAGAAELDAALDLSTTRLLVLPFGSAFPEANWPAIFRFLERGGNLFVLGGRPFLRPAFREGNSWRLRPERMTHAQRLFINEYQATPGSVGAESLPNDDFRHLRLPAFSWQRSFSLTVRLTDEDLYPRGGSGGMVDARLDALAWGSADGRRRSAPLVQIDHFQNNFTGGRWIFLACELAPDFFSTAAARSLLPALVRQALSGAEEFSVRPAWPVFLPGEPWTFHVRWQRFHAAPEPARIELEVADEAGRKSVESLSVSPGAFPFFRQVELPARPGRGLFTVTARLRVGESERAVARNGFWIRDDAALASGPRVSVNEDFFLLDGRPQLILGTTYMASDVQRQFFMQPNPYVWDRDMAELRRAGINMLRTGWWTAWDQVMKQPGVIHEHALRAFEAYLLTARRHGLPVQFTFFSFIPEVFGGANPYLDPEARRRQKELILAFVERFKHVPFLIWDLINEPSFSNPARLWVTRPNRDGWELHLWNEWLAARHRDRAALAEAWGIVTPGAAETLPLPEEDEFSPRAGYRTARGSNALKAHDYHIFAQEQHARWVEELRAAIRATGSRQLVTVGQDEGGGRDRPNSAFFASSVDFTSMHPWWQSDALLWDMLVARQPGKPMLAQEAGVGRQVQHDSSLRRTPEEEAALLERKLALALATGAGAIHWLWHINSYMRDDNEVHIGAERADRTEKPEAEVLRRLARFAAAAGERVARPQAPPVTIVTSQAMQYSALNPWALEAQMNAVRALHYHCRVAGSVLAENQLAALGRPALVILPAPHALRDDSWQRLLEYVSAGGHLLITGSAERDPYWRAMSRLKALEIEAAPAPLLYRQGEILLGGQAVPVSFAADRQEFMEYLRLPNGETFRELEYGRGRLYLAAYPVELAEGLEATASVYRHVLERAGIRPAFEGGGVSPGVLILPSLRESSVLYLMLSESAQEEAIHIRDRSTGAELRYHLPPGRARLVLLDRQTGRILAEHDPSRQ